MVTGDPVIILLYFAVLPRVIIFLVLLAVGVLIVVDSSIAINTLCEFKNLLANFIPFSVLNASTFIIKICKCVSTSNKLSNFSCCFLVILACHRIDTFSMCVGRCVGNSCSYQVLITPLGAIINAPSILPLSYNIAMLSIRTFVLPVPISIKYAYVSLFHDFSKAVN